MVHLQRPVWTQKPLSPRSFASTPSLETLSGSAPYETKISVAMLVGGRVGSRKQKGIRATTRRRFIQLGREQRRLYVECCKVLDTWFNHATLGENGEKQH